MQIDTDSCPPPPPPGLPPELLALRDRDRERGSVIERERSKNIGDELYAQGMSDASALLAEGILDAAEFQRVAPLSVSLSLSLARKSACVRARALSLG